MKSDGRLSTLRSFSLPQIFGVRFCHLIQTIIFFFTRGRSFAIIRRCIRKVGREREADLSMVTSGTGDRDLPGVSRPAGALSDIPSSHCPRPRIVPSWRWSSMERTWCCGLGTQEAAAPLAAWQAGRRGHRRGPQDRRGRQSAGPGRGCKESLTYLVQMLC